MLSKPPKPPVAMTDEEIDAWADQLFRGMMATYEPVYGKARQERGQGDR
ncbi:MAG TPA: hypothetical protein VN889_05330 [Solirubrobacteraceae bacterium]|nr:hypothetical protein [Solirubrobacteraceae bacterium]